MFRRLVAILTNLRSVARGFSPMPLSSRTSLLAKILWSFFPFPDCLSDLGRRSNLRSTAKIAILHLADLLMIFSARLSFSGSFIGSASLSVPPCLRGEKSSTAPHSSPQSASESSPQTPPRSCPQSSLSHACARSLCRPQPLCLRPPARTAPSAWHVRGFWHSSFRCAHPLPRARRSP